MTTASRKANLTRLDMLVFVKPGDGGVLLWCSGSVASCGLEVDICDCTSDTYI